MDIILSIIQSSEVTRLRLDLYFSLELLLRHQTSHIAITVNPK